MSSCRRRGRCRPRPAVAASGRQTSSAITAFLFLGLLVGIGLAYTCYSLVHGRQRRRRTRATTWLTFSGLLGVALLIALGFEFVNGFHDTANAVATVIYTTLAAGEFRGGLDGCALRRRAVRQLALGEPERIESARVLAMSPIVDVADRKMCLRDVGPQRRARFGFGAVDEIRRGVYAEPRGEHHQEGQSRMREREIGIARDRVAVRAGGGTIALGAGIAALLDRERIVLGLEERIVRSRIARRRRLQRRGLVRFEAAVQRRRDFGGDVVLDVEHVVAAPRISARRRG